MGVGRHIVGLGAGVFLGCAVQPTFACESDAQCVAGAVEGVCQIDVGACSFPDDDCPSGQRYGNLSGFSGAGRCVQDDEVDVASSGPNPMPSSSGTTSTGPTDSSTTTTSTATTSSTSGQVSGGSTGSDGSTGGVVVGSTGDSDPITITFGEGNADVSRVTQDTYLDEVEPFYNAGAHADLHVYGNNSTTSLLSFDLEAELPDAVHIVDAQLQLYVGESLSDCTVEFFEVYEAWSEGTQNEVPGAPNWNSRSTSASWMTPGAGPGSRSDIAFAILESPPLGDVTISVPTELIEAWRNEPETNHGMAILSESSMCSGWFMSSEARDDRSRPKLSITYLR